MSPLLKRSSGDMSFESHPRFKLVEASIGYGMGMLITKMPSHQRGIGAICNK
jgi:hypothetical protein